MTETVLILGGTGVFGSRLARLLVQDGGFRVVIASRNLAKAQRLAADLGAEGVAIDTDAPDFPGQMAQVSARIVIDATGPFQGAGYRVARAALACGAHWLDLSDDAAFTAGITALDGEARALGLTALSGVSSVPALSSAAVADLAAGIDDIHLIESMILPGNRAPRGLSVIQAITSQVGRPLTEWRGGRPSALPGWTARKTVTLPGPRPLTRRWASVIGAPDLTLFPTTFNARSVRFFAGLEVRLMHGGLSVLARLVQWRILPSAHRLSRPLQLAAQMLYPLGSDRGGMRVRVQGLDAAGAPLGRDWVLVAEGGDGPFIPAIPALVLCRALVAGGVAPGARACVAEFSLADAVAAMGGLDLHCQTLAAPPDIVFQTALGPRFWSLPAPVRDLHQVIDRRHWSGRASITRGAGVLSRLAAALVRFPPSADDVAVSVTMERRGDTEVWTRQFGTRRFLSHLKAHPLGVTERFGLMTFTIPLRVGDDGLHFPVSAGRFFGIPIPRVLLPQSVSREYVDDQGRACFDVAISLPIAGHVIRYKGWLQPDP